MNFPTYLAPLSFNASVYSAAALSDERDVELVLQYFNKVQQWRTLMPSAREKKIEKCTKSSSKLRTRDVRPEPRAARTHL